MSPLNIRRLAVSACLASCVSAASGAHSPNADADATDGRSISKVNGGIDLKAGSVAGNIETVNGGIEMGDRSQAGSVENVNGGIELGDSVSVKSLETVNGGVSAGPNLRVEDGIEAVNGGLHLGSGAEVGGDVETVNGGIDLDRAHIKGRVEFQSGSLDTGSGSRLDGGIKVSKSTNWKWDKHSKTPRIVIGPDTVVSGDILLERETELFVHDSATIGKVVGGTPQRFSGSKP